MSQSSNEVWDESRQAALIVQILSGELSLGEACRLHALSVEAVRSWVPLYRHQTLRALDEKLLASLLIENVNQNGLGNAAYTGSLTDIPIADLLQTCEMGRKDAVITITRGSERSSIWCDGGVIVDAESGLLRGEAAAYRILALDNGQVSADFRSEARRRTIQLPCHVLLIEAARQKDECARHVAQLNGLQSIFLPAPGAWASDTTLAERQVMALCDGERAVSDVLAASELSDLQSSSTMVSLVARKYLLRDGTSPLPPSVVAGRGADDWGRRSSMYLSLPHPAPSVSRSKRGAPLFVALVFALGVLLWFGFETL